MAISVTLTAGEDVFLYFGTFLAPAVNVRHLISQEQEHSVTFSAGADVFSAPAENVTPFHNTLASRHGEAPKPRCLRLELSCQFDSVTHCCEIQ